MIVQPVRGTWPSRWEPRGAGTFDQEAFTSWWPRVCHELGHLDPRVSEQWVHRHWFHSPYFGFDLLNATSEIRRLSTDAILADVGSVDDLRPDEKPDPQAVFTAFNPQGKPFEPARTMNATGTWNMPILVLESADGFVYDES